MFCSHGDIVSLTWTSSSFLTGIDLTPYLVLNSLDSGADISRRLQSRQSDDSQAGLGASPHMGRGTEVSLTGFRPVGGDVFI